MKGKKSSIRKYQPKSTGVPLQWSTFQKQSSSAKLSEADTIFGKSQIIHRKSWSQIEHLWFLNALFIALNFLSFFFLLPLSGNKTYIYMYKYIYIQYINKRWCCFCVKRILAQTSTSNIFILQNPPIWNQISPRHSFGNMCLFFCSTKKKNLNHHPMASLWLATSTSESFKVGVRFWIAGEKLTLYSLKLTYPFKNGGFFKFRISRFPGGRGYVC